MNRQTAQLLEQHFDTAFAAPDGIKKLRELILTLAMQGKLVPQDPNDPPASELLKKIEAEKQRLSPSSSPHRRGSSQTLPPISPDEVPYELPQGWKWVRLSETYFGIGNKQNQIQTKDYLENGQFPVIDQGKKFITGYYNDKSKLLHIDRPVIIFGDHTKNIKYVDFDFVIGADGVKILCPYHALHARFLYFLIQSFDLTDRGYARHFKVLNDNLAPLPPTSEQHRIVARIDQLMARCDELEKLRAEREQKRTAAHTAAIRQLLDPSLCASASSCEPFDFLSRHFGELYSVKGNVAELRKAILQLAVMGKLVPQDPDDPPASELLKAIEKEKASRKGAKTQRKEDKLPPIKPDEVPYQLPHAWALVRFGDLTTEIATGPFGSMIHKSDYVLNGTPLINPSHMIDGKITHDPSISVTHDMAKKLNSYRLFENDIVMARRGEMGRCAIVTAASDGFLCGTGSFVLRFIDKINRYHILNLFKTEYVREYLGGNSVGTTMTNLNHGILNNMPVLLPPRPEQDRIVAKVDQLMALCDALEQAIDAASGKQTKLLNALMAQI